MFGGVLCGNCLQKRVTNVLLEEENKMVGRLMQAPCTPLVLRTLLVLRALKQSINHAILSILTHH